MKAVKCFLLLLLVQGLLPQGYAQDISRAEPQRYNGMAWSAFVEEIEQSFSLRFFYHPDSIPDKKLVFEEDGGNLLKQLKAFWQENQVKVTADSQGNVFLTKSEAIATSLPQTFFLTKDYSLLEKQDKDTSDFLKTRDEYIADVKKVGAKNKDNKTYARVSGYIRNGTDNAPIVGATIYAREAKTSAVSDNSGFYSLRLKKGTYTFEVQSVESKQKTYEVHVLSDGRLNLFPERKEIALDEVLVTSKKYDNVKSTQMGFEKLNTRDISEVPLALGGGDVIKVSLLLPGIQTVGEGTSGFNVRGSPVDQNMFYIDNVPVYNTSHFLGFYSSFNSNALKDFTLYKSHIPAYYGGRLASVFEINAKTGNMKKFSASGGISPFTADLQVQGPIMENRLSYLVSARSTYSDWIFDQLNNPYINKSSAQFADGLANFSLQLNENNRFKLFGYSSTDDINLAGNSFYNYQNYGASLNWEHIIADKHSLNMDLIYGKYAFEERNKEIDISAYKIPYQMQHNELRASLSLRPGNKHTIEAGFNTIYYHVNPGDVEPFSNESIIEPRSFGSEQALESGIYVSDEWEINDKLSVSAGLRINNFLYLGPGDALAFQENAPRTLETIEDTLQFNRLEVMKSYTNPDFRLSAKYMFNEHFSVKASANRMVQHIFMLSNTIATSPTHKWKLCDNNISPMTGTQYSLGFYSNFSENRYEFSAEFYYKDARNYLDFKDGANVTLSETPQVDVLQGDLDAFGAEFMLKKPYGKLNGWLNYTYSSAKVLLDSKFPEQRANFGKPFPANYDKPHAFNLVANYKISRRWSFSANMVYSTGRPVTLPAAVYYQDEREIVHYSQRNEYRLPDYFRIDMALKLEGNLKARKPIHGTWKFSVYNLTGRDNAYSVYFKTNEEGNIQGYQMSIFAVPVFSVTYNFKLGNYADKYF